MKINGEEVELVTSFDQLRAGMILWSKPCRWCGSSHRYMLITLMVSNAANPDGSDAGLTPRWTVLPKPACERGSARTVAADSVGRGCIYRVVDPKLAQTSTRKREAVRT